MRAPLYVFTQSSHENGNFKFLSINKAQNWIEPTSETYVCVWISVLPRPKLDQTIVHNCRVISTWDCFCIVVVSRFCGKLGNCENSQSRKRAPMLMKGRAIWLNRLRTRNHVFQVKLHRGWMVLKYFFAYWWLVKLLIIVFLLHWLPDVSIHYRYLWFFYF